MTLKNTWTVIPDGTRVQLIWNDEPWFGKVIKTEPIQGKHVFVQWAPSHFSWEAVEDLFPVSEVTEEMVNAAIEAYEKATPDTYRYSAMGLRKAIIAAVNMRNK